MEVASAQVKSALLFASLFSNDSSKITELDVSRNHTETMFEQFNIPISISGKEITTQPNAIEHIKAKDFYVPGDISSAKILYSGDLLLLVVILQFIMLASIRLVQVL